MRRMTSIVAVLMSLILVLSGCGNVDTIEQPEFSQQIKQEETTGNSIPVNEPSEETNQKVSATTFNLNDIPEYNGSPYVAVNDNNPSFTESDYTTKSFEKYAPLDSLGRCGAAYANIGRDIMPTEERGSIGMIKPSGWHSIRYENVDGKYLYNRCHLIGYQLSAENANASNLITGTRYLNIQGMLPFENMVADYIKETGNHVAYRITPIYDGNNLLASGVQMEAYSVEDDGDGICFNVYCYNVQPEITINYATGLSSGPSSKPSSSTSSTVKPNPEPNTGSSNMVWIPNSGSKYHSHAGCSNMKNPSQVTKSEAENRGYEPCKKCW